MDVERISLEDFARLPDEEILKVDIRSLHAKVQEGQVRESILLLWCIAHYHKIDLQQIDDPEFERRYQELRSHPDPTVVLAGYWGLAQEFLGLTPEKYSDGFREHYRLEGIFGISILIINTSQI